MELTGKCKDAFEKWYYSLIEEYDFKTKGFYYDIDYFTDSMKYGVYVDFFDSVGISVNDKRIDFDGNIWFCSIVNNNYIDIKNDMPINHFETRQKARTEAIKSANKIFNNG